MSANINAFERYTEVNADILNRLQAKGYKNIRFKLQSTYDNVQASVEVIPIMDECSGLDIIPLNSTELLDYFDGPSPMTRYVIDRGYV